MREGACRTAATVCALGTVWLLLSSGCSLRASTESSGPPRPAEPLPSQATARSEVGQLATRTLISRAATLRKSGHPAEAIPLYRRALAANIPPSDAAAIRIELAKTLTQAGDYTAAAQEAEAVIRATDALVGEDPVTASILGASAVQTQVDCVSRKDGIDTATALDRLVASSAPGQRPLYLSYRASASGTQGHRAEARADLARIVHDYPQSEWADQAQGLVDILDYGPPKVNPFVPSTERTPTIPNSAQAKYKQVRALYDRKEDAEFLTAAKGLVATLPPASMEAQWLRMSMAEASLRTHDFAGVRREAASVIAQARRDSEMGTFRAVRAARLMAQAQEHPISEEQALRRLTGETKGYERGLYQFALADLLQKTQRNTEAKMLYQNTAEEFRGTQLAVQAMFAVRSIEKPSDQSTR